MRLSIGERYMPLNGVLADKAQMLTMNAKANEFERRPTDSMTLMV